MWFIFGVGEEEMGSWALSRNSQALPPGSDADPYCESMEYLNTYTSHNKKICIFYDRGFLYQFSI